MRDENGAGVPECRGAGKECYCESVLSGEAIPGTEWDTGVLE